MQNHILGIVTLIAVSVFHRHAVAESSKPLPVAIPLDSVVSNGMMGTKHFDKTKSSERNSSLVELIQQSLIGKKSKAEPRQAFVVKGTVDDALQEVYEVLVKKKQPEAQMIAGDKCWIAFFTYDTSQFIHLKDVQREGHVIRIRYRLIPHDSKELTRHLALVPIGDVSAGKYKVEILSTPLEQEYVDKGYVSAPESALQRTVCRPFDFAVINP